MNFNIEGISDALAEKTLLIEHINQYVRNIMKIKGENRDSLVYQFIERHKANPSDIMLCEQTMEDGTIRFWVQYKDECERKMNRTNCSEM